MFLLTFRRKSLARLEPIGEEERPISKDPIFSLEDLAQPSPLGPLSHQDIDKILYG